MAGAGGGHMSRPKPMGQCACGVCEGEPLAKTKWGGLVGRPGQLEAKVRSSLPTGTQALSGTQRHGPNSKRGAGTACYPSHALIGTTLVPGVEAEEECVVGGHHQQRRVGARCWHGGRVEGGRTRGRRRQPSARNGSSEGGQRVSAVSERLSRLCALYLPAPDSTPSSPTPDCDCQTSARGQALCTHLLLASPPCAAATSPSAAQRKKQCALKGPAPHTHCTRSSHSPAWCSSCCCFPTPAPFCAPLPHTLRRSHDTARPTHATPLPATHA